MFLWALAVVVFLLVIRTIQLNKRAAANGFTKGPLILPYIGCALPLIWAVKTSKDPLRGRLNYLKDSVRSYGETVYSPLLNNQMIFTCDPDVVRHITMKTEGNFENYYRYNPQSHQKYDFAWQATKALFGNGIFMTDGEPWQMQRTLATPLFKKDSLDSMYLVFAEKAKVVSKVFNNNFKQGKEFDVRDVFAQYTFDSFGIIGFNTDFHSLDLSLGIADETQPGIVFSRHFDHSQVAISDFFYEPVSSTRGALPRMFRNDMKKINEFLMEMIENHDRNSTSNDLLSKFMRMTDADGQPYSPTWIRDILFSFIVAGRDTTAILMTWATYCILTYPEVEKKLMEEIDECHPGDTPVTAASIKPMKYLNNVITEVLRMYPSVPNTPRTSLKDDVLPNGMKVPAGTSVVYFQYFLHRNPKYWDEPDVFNPDRWENYKAKHPFQFTPFHAGPMQCLGRHMAQNEAKILLVSIFKEFKLRLVPNQDIIPRIGITSIPEPAVLITCEPRENAH